jgi:hypothetical protein
MNLNPHVHSVVPDGLFVPAPSGPLTYAPLPPPTTAEVEELAVTVARRCTERLVTASDSENSDYLDPNLAALCEAFFWSRNAPPGTRDIPLLPGLEGSASGSTAGREEDGL